MDLKQRTESGVLVITFEDERLDATDVAQFKEQVLGWIEAAKIYNVVFDLTPLQLIDSSGLGAFLSILRLLSTQEGDLRLACISDPVRQMFQIVRMQRLFEMFPDVAAAVKSFSKVQA